MRIDSAIIEVLAKAEVSGNTLRLTEQLDRKTYQLESYGGTIEPLPESSFKESGTAVNTCRVVVNKA